MIMKNNASLTFALVLSLGLLSTGCKNILGPYHYIFYSTSFEEDDSINEWEGSNYLRFDDDTPQGGGKRSLLISGGCVWPHQKLDLGRIDHESKYVISFWGKVISLGGNVSLVASSGNNSYVELATVDVRNEEWTKYEVESKISAPKGLQLKLTASSGGFVAGGMLIDLLEISEI